MKVTKQAQGFDAVNYTQHTKTFSGSYHPLVTLAVSDAYDGNNSGITEETLVEISSLIQLVH